MYVGSQLSSQNFQGFSDFQWNPWVDTFHELAQQKHKILYFVHISFLNNFESFNNFCNLQGNYFVCMRFIHFFSTTGIIKIIVDINTFRLGDRKLVLQKLVQENFLEKRKQQQYKHQ